ncbi:MAG TPA: hypothetical protein VK858_07050 [Longimicrobiales bacterium]|nr:hypothetical protein [Longimicrobiales bacterium]
MTRIPGGPRRLLATALALVPLACAPGDEFPQERAGTAGPLPEGATLPADHPPLPPTLPSDHPPMGTEPGTAAVPEDAPTGTVRETIQSGGYTYARLEVEGEEVWSAGPVTDLEEGDRVALVGVMGMEGFRATSLDRTFDRILFVSRFVKR